MTTYVPAVATGRRPVDVTIPAGHGQPAARVQVATVADDVAWTRSRYQVGYALRRSLGDTDAAARNRTCLALALWANESAWGASEWNWNCAGMHCNGATSCENDHLDAGSPLRAYPDAVAFQRDFWTTVDHLTPGTTEWDTGQVVALFDLMGAGYGPETSEATFAALLASVRARLGTGYGPLPDGGYDSTQDPNAGDGGGAPPAARGGLPALAWIGIGLKILDWLK